MTELRKKAIDTCNKALEVLTVVFDFVQTQRLNTPFEKAAPLDEYLRKVGQTSKTVEIVLTWANNSKSNEGLVQMGLDILLTEMKELGFDMEGTKK